MCATTPWMTFDVSEDRITKILTALKTAYPKLTQEQVMEVAYEVGLADGITFDPNGEKPPEMRLTDLQIVAFVAAVVAVAETGGKQSLAEIAV